MNKKIPLAAVLLGAAAFVAHLHASMQTYHPVIKVETPGGLVYTAVLARTADRPACLAASRSFVQPMREACEDCKVRSARCESELPPLEQALQWDEPLPHYVVSMGGVRVAIDAEDAKARQACERIVHDAVQHGAPTAACIFPATQRVSLRKD